MPADVSEPIPETPLVTPDAQTILKRKKRISPTQRTLALLRRCQYRAAVVEKIIPRVFIRKDLYGIIDILAMKPGQPILAIQACITDDLNKRMDKTPEIVHEWLSTGNQFEFWGWSKRGERGKRKLWALTRVVPNGADPIRQVHHAEVISKAKVLPPLNGCGSVPILGAEELLELVQSCAAQSERRPFDG